MVVFFHLTIEMESAFKYSSILMVKVFFTLLLKWNLLFSNLRPLSHSFAACESTEQVKVQNILYAQSEIF